jgi:predicted PurR-regulated permease PerM
MSSNHHLTVIVIITITKKKSIPQKIEKKPRSFLNNLQKTLETLIKSLTNLHTTRQKTLKHISTSIRLAKREIYPHFLSFNLNAVTFNLLLILTLLLLILTERKHSEN